MLGAGLQTGGTLAGAYLNRPASGKRPNEDVTGSFLEYPT